MNFRLFPFLLGLAFAPALATAGVIQELPGQGGIRLDGGLEINLSKGDFFNPVAFSPDVYYGFTKTLVLALTHSAASQGVVGVGRSLQLKGPGDAYNGLNIEMYVPLLNTEIISLAPNAGLLFDSLDPLDYSIKVGGQVNLTLAMVSIIIAPHIVVPVNHRSVVRENTIRVPLWLYYHWTGVVSFYVLSGMNDGSLQFAPGAVVTATESIKIGAQYGWPRFAGENHTLRATDFNLFAQFIF